MLAVPQLRLLNLNYFFHSGWVLFYHMRLLSFFQVDVCGLTEHLLMTELRGCAW